MKNNKIILGVIFVILSFLLFGFKFDPSNNNPKNVFQVYLDGKVIGLTNNKDELLNLINKEQQGIKDKYKVNDVYPPNGFEILPYTTYNEKVLSASDIYQKIKENSDFTIEGYEVEITKPKSETSDEVKTTLYVLDDSILKDAIYKFVTTFVSEDDYNKYITNTQTPVKTVGSIIKNMEFGESIKLKKTYISVKNNIFTDSKSLTQYLLYGTTDVQKNYEVKQGDTLQSIATASKLNVRELLIANPNYQGENAVLAIGDKLVNTLINPVLTFYQEVVVTEDVEQVYNKVTEVDYSMKSGTSEVVQAGVTGLNRITQATRIINGERSQGSTVLSSEVIRPAQDEITKQGPQYVYNGYNGGHSNSIIDTGLNWTWPTNSGYVITTDYEWRWGSFHTGIDISGAGNFGSPIYAARSGVVTDIYTGCNNIGWYGSMCGGSYGNYVVILHENNYYTLYAHLKTDVGVSVGQQVSAGTKIGSMGSSGSSTGAHLHFSFSIGNPVNGGKFYNPWSLYR